MVEPYAADLLGYFYDQLFRRYPGVRDLFPPQMDVQHDKGRPGRVGTRVELFVSARTCDDLHEAEDLLRLSERHRWLRVRAALNDADRPLPEVLAQCGPWPRHDAYLCGPGPMIIDATEVLYRGGVPVERIHHDPFVRPDLSPA
ncbi:hypothetical protein ABZW30_28335 [Kitasatospora sp. NPDC004669]|uniref:hypothetical protein n=1 Tax=Kitasatospora sp. NPDC004669 TaxID=3154555 RepID=UPI00339DD6BA